MKPNWTVGFLFLVFSKPCFATSLSADAAAKLIQLSLDCTEREYPNKTAATFESAQSLKTPRQLHSIFYGCFDWHSAVHGHWAMARILRLYPKHPLAGQILQKLSTRFTPENVKSEVARFEDKNEGSTFERPYGYAWFLRLVSELQLLAQTQPEAQTWLAALKPLEAVIIERTKTYLSLFNIPTRHGVHGNTAFALNHIYDYSKINGNTELTSTIVKTAKKLFEKDKNCPISYEPSGGDFVSSCLAEAELMARVLNASDFQKWLAAFFPNPNRPKFKHFLSPGFPTDPKDPIVGHLIGLNFQKAWALSYVISKLPKTDLRTKPWSEAREHLIDTSLKLMNESGYGGAHWLASFAIFALTQ